MIGPETPAIPTFLVATVRVRGEQDAARFQRGMQLGQYAWQFLAGDMKQRGIGKYAIEKMARKIECEKVLLPHFAAAAFARHFHEMRRPVQTDGHVAHPGKCPQVSPGPATEIENGKRWIPLDIAQQRRDVLADVVIARAFLEFPRPLIVVSQRNRADLPQVLPFPFHACLDSN